MIYKLKKMKFLFFWEMEMKGFSIKLMVFFFFLIQDRISTIAYSKCIYV